MDPLATQVLEFWFGSAEVTAAVDPALSARWFSADAALDATLRERFGALIPRAAAGALAAWEETAPEALALVILLDQFTRNVYRDDPRAFAADATARAIADRALAHGHDQLVSRTHRTFFYLPFEHAEDLPLQERAVALFRALAADDPTDPKTSQGLIAYAVKHRDIIARFGRFPHRNAVLGRASTPDELDFLKTGRGF